MFHQFEKLSSPKELQDEIWEFFMHAEPAQEINNDSTHAFRDYNFRHYNNWPFKFEFFGPPTTRRCLVDHFRSLIVTEHQRVQFQKLKVETVRYHDRLDPQVRHAAEIKQALWKENRPVKGRKAIFIKDC